MALHPLISMLAQGVVRANPVAAHRLDFPAAVSRESAHNPHVGKHALEFLGSSLRSFRVA